MSTTKPLLTCDICNFKVSNSYIFKRHLHRCYSLHGVASNRSTPRKPMRLKGTEKLNITVLSSSAETENKIEGDAAVDVMDENLPEDESSTLTLDSSQQEDQTIEPSAPNISAESLEKERDDGLDESGSVPVTPKDSVNTTEDQPKLNKDRGTPDLKAGAPYSRLYTCVGCNFESKSAREHLYHQRDVHGNPNKIHECTLCDYASHYNNKVERHMVVHNKLLINMDDRKGRVKRLGDEVEGVIEPKNDTTATTGEDAARSSGRLRVKPLKLRRLNVKMGFRSSGGSLELRSRSPPSVAQEPEETQTERTVYKRIRKDGGHAYQCIDCLYYARLASKVKKHHSLCHCRLYRCPHCDFCTLGQGILYEHLMNHSGHGYVQCPDCSYVTNAKSNYEKHRSFHDGQFPYTCSVCSFGSDNESKIKRHITTQHTPSNGMCEGNSSYENGDISQDYGLEEDMGNLQDEVYQDEAQDPQDDSEGTPSGDPLKMEYKCPKCVMVCYRRGNFTRHLITRHGYSQLSASHLSKTMENSLFKGFKRCIKGARNGASTFGHQKMTENLKCPYCSYLAKWPSDLRRHMQVHTSVKRFQCNVCPSKYKYLGDLNVHLRRDHSMEPSDSLISREVASKVGIIKKASPAIYRCPICPFSCQSKAELEQHSRTHGNITKTYQCRLCNYQTYWRGDVGRHLFRHHEIVLSKDGQEIEDYFILRPDIKPLTKQAPASAVSQAVFPGNPDPPMLLDQPQEFEDGDLQEQENDEGTEEMMSMDDENFALLNDDTEPPKLSAQVPTSPVMLKEGSFVCEYPNCDFKTTISDRMEVHLGVHLNIKMFMCPTCGKRTNWKWDVVKHMTKVHNNPTAAIEDVITLSMEKAKATIAEYMNSSEKRRQLVINYCSLCDFQSLEKNRVVRHLGTVHKNQNGKVVSRVLDNSENLESSSGKDQGQSHEFNAGLSMMSSSLAGEEVGVMSGKFEEPPSEELAKYEKPYACAICKKPEISKGDVKKHYSYAHPYKEVRVIYVGDGTEFNCDSGEIYSKRSKAEIGEYGRDSASSTISPVSGKPIRPDSKFSNPRAHGYVKPFKCSICGVRSNWKWDLKKHLRSKHRNEGGFVIMLSLEEAAETYGKECTPSHPKTTPPNLGRTSPYAALSSPSPTPKPDHQFKAPLQIKKEKIDDSYEDSDDFKGSSFFPRSPPSSSQSLTSQDGDKSDPVRRQWKCSGCDYISFWRRNMARHIHRKHRGQEGYIKILPLHKTQRQKTVCSSLTQQSISMFLSNRQNPGSNLTQLKDGSSELRSNGHPKPIQPGSMKLWRCPKCSFKSVLRTHIIGHMQQHEMKPFKCGVCNAPFMNRGPLHKHLQRVHKCGDYIRQCKVNIPYGDDEDVDDSINEVPTTVKRGNDGGVKQVTTETRGGSEYINSFFCRLCNMESTERGKILQHLETAHGSKDNDNNILKIQKRIGSAPSRQSLTPPSASMPRGANTMKDSMGRRMHYCHVCPYRTQKKQMLMFHMTYHRPSGGNRLKCKYCPYYVGNVRLLHQHQRKWHEGGLSIPKGVDTSVWVPQDQKTPNASPTKAVSGSPGSSTGRRHACEKCPYTTNSKNDFIYHKQFHRPKRTAEFKCEYCDYWVVHKRLLKQHMRLHTQEPPAPEESVQSSPAKSLYSDPGLLNDPAEQAELAAIKQKMITSKITASLSQSPTVSPMKLATSIVADDGQPTYVLKGGFYRKLHKCKKCPYTNIRARNMKLHEMMHGPRVSPHPLMKCPYCDYYVGSKGLLSHHIKIHKKSYGDSPAKDAEMAENGAQNGDESDHEILPQQKADTLLQISRFKRFACERCPYASAKRQHFERHLELHGSRQRYTCQYCDYSVPSNNLLLQHQKLHMMPNQNLLAAQSVTNLHHLGEVPADVALASALPPADTETTVTISVIHDHLGLYENSIYDSEPKKLYRCDRCPYANVRRDYLLSHLKFHMVTSAFACPYCDYSAPKQSLLTQHVRVHFCPLPELSDWLLENGQTERDANQKQMDLGEALKIAREYQNQNKAKSKLATEKSLTKGSKSAGKENLQNDGAPVTYICQYCDREFKASDVLIKHELQHLIGNHFERNEYVDRNKKEIEQVELKKAEENKKAEEEKSPNGQSLKTGTDGKDQEMSSTSKTEESTCVTPSGKERPVRRWSINSGGRASPGSSSSRVEMDRGERKQSTSGESGPDKGQEKMIVEESMAEEKEDNLAGTESKENNIEKDGDQENIEEAKEKDNEKEMNCQEDKEEEKNFEVKEEKNTDVSMKGDPEEIDKRKEIEMEVDETEKAADDGNGVHIESIEGPSSTEVADGETQQAKAGCSETGEDDTEVPPVLETSNAEPMDIEENNSKELQSQDDPDQAAERNKDELILSDITKDEKKTVADEQEIVSESELLALDDENGFSDDFKEGNSSLTEQEEKLLQDDQD